MAMKPVWAAKEIEDDIEKYRTEHFNLTCDCDAVPKKLSPMQEKEAAYLEGRADGLHDALMILRES